MMVLMTILTTACCREFEKVPFPSLHPSTHFHIFSYFLSSPSPPFSHIIFPFFTPQKRAVRLHIHTLLSVNTLYVSHLTKFPAPGPLPCGYGCGPSRF